jgi:uncharacterized protein (AIM24 family)
MSIDGTPRKRVKIAIKQSMQVETEDVVFYIERESGGSIIIKSKNWQQKKGMMTKENRMKRQGSNLHWQ